MKSPRKLLPPRERSNYRPAECFRCLCWCRMIDNQAGPAMAIPLALPATYFHTRSSRENGRGSPAAILEKSGCRGLITKLCSVGMIAEGTRRTTDASSRTHFVPRSLVKSGGGDESQPASSASMEISEVATESGISRGIARSDLLIVMSFLVK